VPQAEIAEITDFATFGWAVILKNCTFSKKVVSVFNPEYVKKLVNQLLIAGSEAKIESPAI
jgi:hypothetical protein